MRTRIRAKFAGVLALSLAAGGLAAALTGAETASAAHSGTSVVCNDGALGSNFGATPAIEYDMEARDGYIEMPDGNTVYTWSFAEVGDAFQFPGPNLCVSQGDVVRVRFRNPSDLDNLTGGIPAQLTSIVFPGQTGVTASGGQGGLLTNEVSQSTTITPDYVTYEFTATNAGTYMYESGSDPAVQIQMGMFGGLVVYPTGPTGHAYAETGLTDRYAYDTDHEYLLLFHEIDAALHTEVELLAWGSANGNVVLENYDPSARHSRYYTINGRAFPDTLAPNNTPVLMNQPYSSLVSINADDPDNRVENYGVGGYDQLPSLVRYGNAGLDNHPFHPHGDTLTLIGQDGRTLPDEIDAFTKTVASGQTYDLLAGWEDVEAWQEIGTPEGIILPILDNTIFKGGVSFYSGDPALGGQEQQLPVDVTTFTVCGEYYFPWHSHALNEIVNFDEAFGGMLTLWRVDPPKVNIGGNWVGRPECG